MTGKWLQKWKRRRATPIQISPFFYLSNPSSEAVVYVPAGANAAGSSDERRR